MTALLAGATGLVGRELARAWVGPGLLHLLVRRPLAIAVPRSQRVHVVDFAALPALPKADEAYCCLGTTIKTAGSQAAFRAIDFDAVLAFAHAAQRAGVQPGRRDARFHVPAARNRPRPDPDGWMRAGMAEVGQPAIGVDGVLVVVLSPRRQIAQSVDGQFDLIVAPDVGAVVDDDVVAHVDGQVERVLGPGGPEQGAGVGRLGRRAAGRLGAHGVSAVQRQLDGGRRGRPVAQVAVHHRRRNDPVRIDRAPRLLRGHGEGHRPLVQRWRPVQVVRSAVQV